MIFLMLMRSFTNILVFTPLNNTGVVERNHHHRLLHVAKVLIFQSHIPLQLLGEATSPLHTLRSLPKHCPTKHYLNFCIPNTIFSCMWALGALVLPLMLTQHLK